MQLAGKSAIVTGSSKGIGKAIAVALARGGADVLVNYHSDEAGAKDTVARIEHYGRKAVIMKANTSVYEEVEQMVSRAVEEFGKLDVMVNNAAVMFLVPAVEMKIEDWHKLIGVNLNGYFYGCQLAARQMIKQGQGGKIINVASINDILAVRNMSAYCAAKGGVISLTRTLAIELGCHRINVNALSPGATETELNKNFYTQPVRNFYAERIPWGKIAMPEQIAEGAVFLASNASEYITGHELVVDGGLSINGSVQYCFTGVDGRPC